MSNPPLSIHCTCSWNETAPGWNVAARIAGEQNTPGALIGRSTELSGFNPIGALEAAVDNLCRQINIHPDNTNLWVAFDGGEVLDIATRAKR